MSPYDKFKIQIAPPILFILFTSSVQILALFGKGENVTWKAIWFGLTGNFVSWTAAVVFYIWAYFWLIVARSETKGSRAPDGSIPIYKNNGVFYYIVTVITYLVCQFFMPNISYLIYDNIPQILGTQNAIALLLCTYLYLKSSEGTGKFPRFFLFYRGRELHPKIFGVQVKQLVITRISMMLWQIQVLAYFFTAWERRPPLDLATTVTCLIQVIYLFKLYIYEAAYFTTLDITMDRPGYYLMWGTLVLVPCLYSYNSYYLVNHPPLISDKTAILILLLGILAIIGTAVIDFEKDRFRRTNGKTLIWNKPPKYIKAQYTDQTGTVRNSLLLTSGFWGLARHLNYTLEILTNLSWCLTGHGLGISVYFFIIFLTVLLLHRIYRDETKCNVKYGKYWNEYCKKVPYRLIPNVF